VVVVFSSKSSSNRDYSHLLISIVVSTVQTAAGFEQGVKNMLQFLQDALVKLQVRLLVVVVVGGGRGRVVWNASATLIVGFSSRPWWS